MGIYKFNIPLSSFNSKAVPPPVVESIDVVGTGRL